MTQRPLSRPPLRLGRALSVAIAVFGLALVSTGCSSSGKDPTKMTKKEQLGLYFENALWYLQLGDLDRAQFQAEQALKIDPGNERFELIYARTNLMRGTAASVQESLRIFDAHPNRVDYRWQMTYAAALERKGNFYEEASRGVREGERATPAADRQARADELMTEAQAHWQRAQQHFERSLEQRSGETEALNGLVRVTALLGDFEASVKWSDELAATIRESQFLVRAQLEAPDLTSQREAQLRDSLRKNREFEVKTRLMKATLLRRLARPADAVRELDEVIALEPELAQANSMRGQLLMDLGEYVKARAAFQRFLDLTDLPFDDAQVRRAFDLQDECERHARASG